LQNHSKNKVMNNKRIIKVQVLKEIWDAHMSIWNWRRDIMGAWMKSIQEAVNQVQNNKKV